MLQRLHRRLGTAGLAVAVIALIAALGGTALAAKGALTGKQKKEVEKIAKKYAGKPGAPGAAGAQGPAGAAGAAGKDGANGINGKDGTNGVSATTVAFTGSKGTCTKGQGGVEVKSAGATTFLCNGEEGLEGEPGEAGQDAGFDYTFNSSTAEADPGTGALSLNNTSAESATLLWISETDSNSNLLDKVMAGWASSQTTKGTILIRKAGDPTTFAEFTITGIRLDKSNKDEGTFDKFTVAFVQGHGTLANSDPITVAYFAAGSESLPTGPIEMGAWSVTGTAGDTAGIRVPISFSPRLNASLGQSEVHFEGDAEFGTFCEGSATVPKPKPGNLCIYVNPGDGLVNTAPTGIYSPSGAVGGEEQQSGLTGAILLFSAPTGVATGSGTFGLRAP